MARPRIEPAPPDPEADALPLELSGLVKTASRSTNSLRFEPKNKTFLAENFQFLKLKDICLLHGQVFIMSFFTTYKTADTEFPLPTFD